MIAAVVGACIPASAQVRYEDILKGPGDEWLTYAGDYAGQRHSPLKQITRENVASLVPKWTYHIEGARKLEATPIVHDGIMYVTGNNEVHALDPRTGRPIWVYREDQATKSSVNRGVAILGDRVFFVTGDCHLIALHRKTGALLWNQVFADASKGYYASLAPLVVKDRIIVGVSGGDGGIRGYINAHSAETGEELWRFWTVPAKGEPGSETWAEFPTEYGGGATWLSGTFDPALNLIYWTTGNPWPDFYGEDRRGDNLYTCSVVALDANTGKLKWYFQFTPHDTHDWDAQSWPILVDLPFKGRMRKLLLHPNRNGFFYVLDRTTGEFLLARQMLDKLNWAKGIDEKGRPIEDKSKIPTAAGVFVCPALRGGPNWMSSSYNPDTKLIYVPMLEQCEIFTASTGMPEPGKGIMGGGFEKPPREEGKFYLRAIDPTTGERRWEYPMTGPGTMWAGTLSTAGGLIFFGDDDGHLVAVDARAGTHLWHYNMGQSLHASPMTFRIDGKQYVSISSQTDIFTFGLFEPAASVPLVPEKKQ